MRRTTLVRFGLACSVAVGCGSPPPPSPGTAPSPQPEGDASKPSYPGIWVYNVPNIVVAGRPWVRGNEATLKWSDIEPVEGNFAWTKLDQAVADADAKGISLMVLVYTGRNAPAWLYAPPLSLPRYHTDFQMSSDWPFYLNETYKSYFKRMLQAVKERLETGYPTSARNRIVSVQVAVGASGDPHPYKTAGTGGGDGSGGDFGLGTPYEITPEAWDAFQRAMFQSAYDLYRATSPPIHPLFNTAYSTSITQWVADTMPGAWMKTGRMGDRYQNNGETRPGSVEAMLPLFIGGFYRGLAIRSRSEMDLTYRTWFTEAPVWNMYWTQLWDLHEGQDMHMQLATDLDDARLQAACEFYTRYAGYKDPRDSVGVWVALHDGLDASDTTRFPENAEFGAATRGNAARYAAIAKRFAPFGARQNDPAAGGDTSWSALNDVGWQIQAGNYEMWLSQWDPAGTSAGLWRQGPTDQMYGRFARRFDGASGRSVMYFDIDDRFFFGSPLNGSYPVTVRVIYLDTGTGRWALTYDAQGGLLKSIEVTKTNSQTWKEARFVISDGYFGNRCPHG